MIGGKCCTFLIVPLLAILLGTGLVKVDVTPLCAAAGKLVPVYIPKTSAGKALVVKNEEIRNFLLQHGWKGPMAERPEGEQAPLQGVYMFDQMGPAGWIDFSTLSQETPGSGAWDINIWDITAQYGSPTPKFGGIGPFIPGGYLLVGAEKIQYRVRFYCPAQMKDGDYCRVVESFAGSEFPGKDDSAGPMYWKMTRFQGGRKYVRDTWLAPPWATADETYAKTHGKFHSYNLLLLMHPNRTIDEENFNLLLERFNGEGLILPTSLSTLA